MSEKENLQEEKIGQALENAELETLPSFESIPIWPFYPAASGLYKYGGLLVKPSGSAAKAKHLSGPIPILPWLRWEELRLDVDGRYPQMTASGTIYSFIRWAHWIASLKKTGTNSWTGNIWYKDGVNTLIPFSTVDIQVIRNWFPHLRSATVTFSGAGMTSYTRVFEWKSYYFHPVEFEYDCAQGTTAVTSINTHDHPNRPATLPKETLTIETVYRRAGFDVKKSSGDDVVPMTGAGPDAKWNDIEMHDAMQVYWSRFANKHQWAMWTFFASLHVQGYSLGGIMFDDIGPNHRQGTAIFNDSFISESPVGDANPTAWVRRMRFWTAVHEMGHVFNLAHSWQKSLGVPYGIPWIALVNEPEARSFMNYPFRVAGGQSAFFNDFEFRFSDGELLFMRHSPARFVQPGNADWFDHHGFQKENLSPEPAFKLEARVNRSKALFEFLEPVMMELKLTNISSQPQIIDENTLSMPHHMTVIIKKIGKPARQFTPYAHYCMKAEKKVLAPNESDYGSLFISAGQNGWDLSEPGYYTVQVALHLENEAVVSEPLILRIAPPRGYDEEFLAQDFFSDDIGRILAFGGSQFFQQATDTLREIAEKLGDCRVAAHANFLLGNSVAFDYKKLDLDAREVKIISSDVKAARANLSQALTERMDMAAETLGHIKYKNFVTSFTDFLAEKGEKEEAVKIQDGLHKTLASRNVLERVLQDIKRQCDVYKK